MTQTSRYADVPSAGVLVAFYLAADPIRRHYVANIVSQSREPARPPGHLTNNTDNINLIIRYTDVMRTITATEASRRFSDLLDAIERGETIIITRGHHPVAEIGPVRRRTGADLRTALADIPPPDDRFADDIADALALVTPEERDPWADA